MERPRGARPGSRRRMVAAVSLAVVAMLTVALPAVPVNAAKTKVNIAVGKNKFKPVHHYIGKGDVVIWKNPKPKKASKRRVHDITSIQPGRWKKKLGFRLNKVLKPGATVKKKFRRKGTFRYRCARHSAIINGKCQGMCGFIHVL